MKVDDCLYFFFLVRWFDSLDSRCIIAVCQKINPELISDVFGVM